jgi:thioredoxin 1
MALIIQPVEMVHQVDTHTELDSIIKSTDGLIVVDFFADWCGPCKRIAPKIEQWATQFPSITFLKVNSDENEESSAIFEVTSLPTFVALKRGKIVATIIGANETALVELINRN